MSEPELDPAVPAAETNDPDESMPDVNRLTLSTAPNAVNTSDDNQPMLSAAPNVVNATMFDVDLTSSAGPSVVKMSDVNQPMLSTAPVPIPNVQTIQEQLAAANAYITRLKDANGRLAWLLDERVGHYQQENDYLEGRNDVLEQENEELKEENDVLKRAHVILEDRLGSMLTRSALQTMEARDQVRHQTARAATAECLVFRIHGQLETQVERHQLRQLQLQFRHRGQYYYRRY